MKNEDGTSGAQRIEVGHEAPVGLEHGQPAPTAPTVAPATSKAWPRSKRKRPLHTLSMTTDGWARLDEIATRLGLSRSATVELLVREAQMPRELKVRTG